MKRFIQKNNYQANVGQKDLDIAGVLYVPKRVTQLKLGRVFKLDIKY